MRRNNNSINIIVAVDREGGFGKDGKIPWHFSEDLKHFKAITDNAVCIMGRRTYEDMIEMVKKHRKDEPITELLPGRQCFVVTSNPDLEVEGATAIAGITEALDKADLDRPIFVVGGEKMYIEALSVAQTVHMSVVKGDSYECDRFFPIEYLQSKFAIVAGTETDNIYYVKYERKPKQHFKFGH